jgi:hypothetical protein
MVMLRPPGKPYEVAKKILKTKGIKVPKPDVVEKNKVKAPFPFR